MKMPLRILLVEDEVIIALDMQYKLEQSGYGVCKHEVCGEDAIATAREMNPDLVLMDIRLSGDCDGIEAALSIKKYINCPVVFITGYDNTSVRKRVKQIPASYYLNKPFKIEELKPIVDSFVSGG